MAFTDKQKFVLTQIDQAEVRKQSLQNASDQRALEQTISQLRSSLETTAGETQQCQVDDPIFIDNDTLSPAELFDGNGDLVNRTLRDLTAVPEVRNRPVDRPHAHLEIVHPYLRKLDWDLSECALCARLSNRALVY